MGSFNEGKEEAIRWIKDNFNEGDTCLDVGACNGKWADLLGGYLTIDGIEIYRPYIERYNIIDKYRSLFNRDIREFEYEHYDLIIFGDVLEHMSTKDAQKVIKYADSRCKNMIVAGPYEYPQGAKRGNPYEVHIQDDLTPEIFDKRYPGFVCIYHTDNYAYYVKERS